MSSKGELMFTDTLFRDTIDIINRWNPKESYPTEPKYRDDLMNYMRKCYSNNQSPFSPQKRISVRKEAGRGYCDIAVDRRIGVELKKDLSKKSQINRLIGQIVDYKREYDDIIIVLIGNTSLDALDGLNDSIEDLNKGQYSVGMNQEPRIKIINKAKKKGNSKKKSGNKKRNSKPYNPLNVNLPNYKPPKFDW